MDYLTICIPLFLDYLFFEHRDLYRQMVPRWVAFGKSATTDYWMTTLQGLLRTHLASDAEGALAEQHMTRLRSLLGRYQLVAPDPPLSIFAAFQQAWRAAGEASCQVCHETGCQDKIAGLDSESVAILTATHAMCASFSMPLREEKSTSVLCPARGISPSSMRTVSRQ